MQYFWKCLLAGLAFASIWMIPTGVGLMAGTIKVNPMPDKKLPSVYVGEEGTAEAKKAGKGVKVEFDLEKSDNPWVHVVVGLEKEIKDPVQKITLKVSGTKGLAYAVGVRGGSEGSITSYIIEDIGEKEEKEIVIDVDKYEKGGGKMWGALESSYPIQNIMITIKPIRDSKEKKGFLQFSDIVIETK